MTLIKIIWKNVGQVTLYLYVELSENPDIDKAYKKKKITKD